MSKIHTITQDNDPIEKGILVKVVGIGEADKGMGYYEKFIGKTGVYHHRADVEIYGKMIHFYWGLQIEEVEG